MKHVLTLSMILLVCGLGIPSEAAAAEKRLIAVIMANSQPRYQDVHAVFVENAETFCGTDCRIYVQTPNADVMSLRNSVRKAVALGAELIVTYGPAATLAAKSESPPMPVAFADVYDPVGLGLISSRQKKNRSMTGVRGDAPVQALLKYFVEATNARKLAILYDPKSPAGNLQNKILMESGRKKEVTIIPLVTKDTKSPFPALQSAPADVDGLFLAESEHAGSSTSLVLEFASERQMPVITQRDGAAEMGAFMVLETSATEQGEKLAEMVGEILAGKKINEIKMQAPHQVAFVVNLKVAKEYGITVPFQTLSVASRVVR